MSDADHLPTGSFLCSTSLHLGGELESSPCSLPLSPKASASFFYSPSLDSLAFIEFLRFCLELFKTWTPEAYNAHKSVKLWPEPVNFVCFSMGKHICKSSHQKSWVDHNTSLIGCREVECVHSQKIATSAGKLIILISSKTKCYRWYGRLFFFFFSLHKFG